MIVELDLDQLAGQLGQAIVSTEAQLAMLRAQLDLIALLRGEAETLMHAPTPAAPDPADHTPPATAPAGE